MPEDQNITPSKEDTSTGTTNPSLPTKRVPVWAFVVWGILTFVVALLFTLSLLLKKPNGTMPSDIVSTASNNHVFTEQTVWSENFNHAQLEGWKVDWANLHESDKNPGNVLVAYHNMPTDKRFPVKYSYNSDSDRFFYGQSPEIPLNFLKSYSISFDFHGNGPIELVDFGHVRLKLTGDMPNLSFDADGNHSYRTFPLLSWTQDQMKQETHSFTMRIIPEEQNYEIYIDNVSIGKVHYSKNITPLNQIYFRELDDSNSGGINVVYYDNFSVFGTPTRRINPSDTITAEKPATTPTPVSPELTKLLKSGWDKHNMGDFASAIQIFKQATKMDPKSAEAYNALGVAYRSSGDTTAALQAFAQSLTADSTYAPAKENLGIQ